MKLIARQFLGVTCLKNRRYSFLRTTWPKAIKGLGKRENRHQYTILIGKKSQIKNKPKTIVNRKMYFFSFTDGLASI